MDDQKKKYVRRDNRTCPYTKNEWTPIQGGARPPPYQLVEIALSNGKSKPGWWSGYAWEGRRIKPDDEITAFKIRDY